MNLSRRASRLALIGLCVLEAAAADLSGRVKDLQGLPLAGVKVTLHPRGTMAVTMADGSFRLDDAALPASLAPAASPDAPLRSRPDLGFRLDPGSPAVDLRGRRSPPSGNPWLLLASLPGTAAPSTSGSQPLAKAAGASSLTAEKPGYQTAHIPLATVAALRDIVLAPGLDMSRPLPLTSGNGYVVPPLPRVVGFSGSTSTELPNLHDPTDSAGKAVDSVVFALRWEFSTEPGVALHVRPYTYFPRFPEALATAIPAGVSGESGQVALDLEEVAFHRNQALVLPENAAPAVNLLLWRKAAGSAYGAIHCLQFPGPIKSGWKAFEELQGLIPLRIRTNYAGMLPALDLAGRLSGKVAWKGPGPMPELWIGMAGTELFAPIAPDGTFLSTDLPPGRPPVVLVRVDRSGDGAAVPRAFQGLGGLEVVPGQTAVLDSLILTGE